MSFLFSWVKSTDQAKPKPKRAPKPVPVEKKRPAEAETNVVAVKSVKRGHWNSNAGRMALSECPGRQRVPGTLFVVDEFHAEWESPEGRVVSFLSHYHSDHYGGLGRGYAGVLYCSSVTRALVLAKLHVEPGRVRPLDIGQSTLIDGVKVTALGTPPPPA